MRQLRCAIEDLAAWYSRLFLEPHIVAATAILSRYSPSPAKIEVECSDVVSQWLGTAKGFSLKISWGEETAFKAQRLRATIQAKPLVELASIALALVLGHRVVPFGQLEVTDYGDRADFRSISLSRVVEVSGTENLGEFGRRHRQKVEQAVTNPFGWDAYVIVCAFTAKGHRIRFSGHNWKEANDVQEG